MSHSAEVTATVSSKGQVVIPSAVRRRLGLTQGSVLHFVLEGDSVRLFAASGDIRKLKGCLPAPPQPVSLQDMDDAIAQRRAAAGSA
jgi:antitoxin PrlF